MEALWATEVAEVAEAEEVMLVKDGKAAVMIETESLEAADELSEATGGSLTKFDKSVRDGRMDGRADGRAQLLIEMRGRFFPKISDANRAKRRFFSEGEKPKAEKRIECL